MQNEKVIEINYYSAIFSVALKRWIQLANALKLW